MDFVLAAILAVASLLGLAAAPRMLRSDRLRRLGLAFATGTLLAVVIGHVLPEAMAGSDRAAWWFLGGFVLMMLVHQHVLKADPCCGHEHVQHAALPSFLALALCSLNDGVLLYADRAHGLGSPILWALAVHKATAAFSLYLLLREVARPARALRWVYLGAFVALAPLTFLAAGQITELGAWIPVMLGLAGGSLESALISGDSDS